MIIKNTLQTTCFSIPTIHYSVILPKSCRTTLLWLHGYRERSENLLRHEIFIELAEQYQTAILLPDVLDTYYLNQDWNKNYTETFLISEFLPTSMKQYGLPTGRDTVCIGGISMGGFGSLLLGSHYPDQFYKIASVSGAFIINDLLIGNPEVTGYSANNLQHFQDLFGDIPSLGECPNRNPQISSLYAQKNKILPPIFLSCGTDDLLYSRNMKLFHLLTQAGADVTWKEASGNHNWTFFESVLPEVFQWLTTEHCQFLSPYTGEQRISNDNIK